MTPRPPNIVFVFCDQLRQAGLGCYEQDPVITPNLDRFAEQSLVLTHCVSNQPVCTPYRAMLFTGQYPTRSGMFANCHSGMDLELNDDTVCLSDVLAQRGYSQGYVGKLHLHKPRAGDETYGEGPRPGGLVWDAYTPPGSARHGFDFWHSYGCYDGHMTPHYWVGDARRELRIDPGKWSVEHETDVAIDYVRNPEGQHRDPDRPFMLMVSHNPPHPPYDQVPENFVRPFRDRPVEELLNRPNVQFDDPAPAQKDAAEYFGAIHGIDHHFQRLLAALDEQGLADNTIVVFTADHGEMLHSHGRMQKRVWYDESMLVPWLIRWPGHIAPRRDDLLFNAVDIYPTLLGLAGQRAHIPTDLDGDDFSELMLTGQGERPDSALYFLPRTQQDLGPNLAARGLRTHRHMFVVFRNGDGTERTLLHDCVTDPHQRLDVAADHPEVVAALHQELTTRLTRAADPWVETALDERPRP